jgi:hypothetical protein
MHLKPGMDAKHVASQFRDQVNQVSQVSTSILEDTQMINNYIAWVSNMQRFLRNYYVNPGLSLLLTTRYFHLHDLMHSRGGRRIPEMIGDEAQVQADWMTLEADELASRAERFGKDPDATIAIPDTNIFMYGEPEIQSIPWRSWLPMAGPIQLVIPIRVIDELDDLKFRPGRKDRARHALRNLGPLIDRPNVPTSIGDQVTIESYVPPGARAEIFSGDSEILIACDDIRTYAGRTVTVITRDWGMRQRAVNLGYEASLIDTESNALVM